MNPKLWLRAIEDWWFDKTRHVQTRGLLKPDPSSIVGEVLDSNIYGAVRPANAHTAIRDLPVGDLSQYTFIDMGSGKGRMLFIASEYPFRRIVGVEYSVEMHRAALENLRAYRHSGRHCRDIESCVMNAADYQFPEGNLIIYLFNSFGPEILHRMLANLERSLAQNPRHTVIVMLWPEHASTVAEFPGMRTYRQTRRYHIYETGPRPAVIPA